jgi:NADPH:quinone reductase-like Zn-dependent oxidoreductase
MTELFRKEMLETELLRVPEQDLEMKFRRLADMLARRDVSPLQKTVFSVADILTALRQFTQAKHVGKLVVRFPPKTTIVPPPGTCHITPCPLHHHFWFPL